MSHDQDRALVTGRVWQAIAQSGVDVSALSHQQQQHLVMTLSDMMLATFDEMMGEHERVLLDTTNDDPFDGFGTERVLWEGRPFLSLVERYIITNERVRVQRGLLSQQFDDIDLIRIQDVDMTQQLTERMVNIGDIYIRSTNPSLPEIILRNVTDPITVHEILRRAVLQARKTVHFAYREDM